MPSNKRKTLEEFIKQASLKHNYEFDYSESTYINTGTLTTIICKKHGKFQQAPRDHLSGQGCPFCRGLKVCFENCLATLKPDLALEWDYERSFPLTPNDVVINSHIKVGWVCKFGHKWDASIISRNKGCGCPCCAGQIVCNENCLATKNPTLALEWHPTDNLPVTPFDVTSCSHQEAIWICPKGHKYKATVNNRNVSKTGCPFCSGNKVCIDNCLATLNPTLALQWHPTLNGLLTPNDVTCNNNRQPWWKCPCGEDHIWQATIASRNKGIGCPFCAGNSASKTNNLAVLRPDIAKQWDYEFNFPVKPEDVTVGSDKKYGWQCDNFEDHKWEATVTARTHGTGCPDCNESRGNKKIAEILKELNIKHGREYTNDGCKNKRHLPFDVSIFDNNEKLIGLVEYQGEQHFKSINHWKGESGFEYIKKNDLIKFNYCKDNNIPLLVIPHWDYKNIEELVGKFMETL